ncbi:dTMP kinase [Synechococcus sp. PCC 6312]|uniref:dTMP kinase n=1 Tax=Synechococcus sp. (strain ATCC 27167 / PCC 6312) TaxID=195253 RepID=UPI00029F2E93|nr:thymidylate kinase [Synechococcus sp. PCC 6312]
MGKQIPGRFIVWEGGEGAGKTTQIGLTQAWLQESGWSEALQTLVPQLTPVILLTREPGGTALGQHLRQLLLHSPTDIAPACELLLYAADRAQHLAEKIMPHLDAGGLVLCDRFTDSTVAYQGYGRGLDLGMIHQLNQIATAGRQPDLTLWLDVTPTQGLGRAEKRSGSQDRMEQATLAFHQRVHQGFTQLSGLAPERIKRIDANCPQAEVTAQIQSCLRDALRQWYPQISAP